MSRAPKPLTTVPQLRRAGKLWQKRLKLDDWEITYDFVKDIPVTDPDLACVGWTGWDSDRRVAWVEIVKVPEDGAEIESTLIHELLHITISGHTSVHGRDVNEERAINAITAALMLGFRR